MPWIYEAYIIIRWAAAVIVLCVALYAIDKRDENNVKVNHFTDENSDKTDSK